MPYIAQDQRNEIDIWLDKLKPKILSSPGNLAYCIYQLMIMQVGQRPLYSTLATSVGVATTCIHEFTRRIIVPYEDMKIKENGDVIHGLESGDIRPAAANSPVRAKDNEIDNAKLLEILLKAVTERDKK